MLKMIRNTTIILLAAWMIMASGGFALYANHCSCTGDAEVSLLIDQYCQQNNQDDANDAPKADACCSIPVEEESCCTAHGEKSCCDSEALVFFKTSEYTATAVSDVKPLLIEIPAIQNLLQDEFSLAELVTKKEHFLPLFKPPVRKTFLLYCGAFHSALSA